MSSLKIVVVIPIKGSKFLMVRNPKRGWEFPGGKIEPGESFVEAAKRECKEEAGVIVENIVELDREGDIVFLAADIKEILNVHQFERSFFRFIPEGLAFSYEEVEKYVLHAFANLKKL